MSSCRGRSRTLWASDDRRHVEHCIETFGLPLQRQPPRGYEVNENYFAGEFVTTHRLLFDLSERDFYSYCESRGLWECLKDDEVKQQLASHLLDLRRGIHQDIVPATTSKRISSIFSLCRAQVGVERPFASLDYQGRLVHVTNGMVDVKSRELKPFNAEWYSRNQIPIYFDPAARCPQFETFLTSTLSADDILTLQRWFGLLVIGANLAQKIAVFAGVGGSGKTTLMRIAQTLVGLQNCGELRTEHLGKQFEMAAFLGKLFLCGADVPGDFLMKPNAHRLKALTGGELMTAELKRRGFTSVYGIFNIAVTCNATLRIRLDGDADAWRRRLLIFSFQSVPKKPIPRFSELLVKQEGSGILNWSLRGAEQLLFELEKHGTMLLSTAQQNRIDDLLEQSDPVRAFVRRLEVVRANVQQHPVSSRELLLACQAYMRRLHVEVTTLPSEREIQRQLVDLIYSLHGLAQRHDLPFGRGYLGLCIPENLASPGECQEATLI